MDTSVAKVACTDTSVDSLIISSNRAMKMKKMKWEAIDELGKG